MSFDNFRLVTAFLSLLFIPGLASAIEGRYQLSNDDTAIMRITTTPNGDILVTAESLGKIRVPQHPLISQTKIHAMRFLNGHFVKSGAGKFQKIIEKSKDVIGDEYYVFIEKIVEQQFEHTPNAAISGYNNKKIKGDVSQCKKSCIEEKTFTCKSFDYAKVTQECDLSSAQAKDVGGLKTDYKGHPYDHYSNRGISNTTAGDELKVTWVVFPDASTNYSYRKSINLKLLPELSSSPTIPQDLAGRWYASNSVYEIFSTPGGSDLTVIRSHSTQLIPPSPEELFSQRGSQQTFISPLNIQINALDSKRINITQGQSILVYSRDIDTPAIPGSEKRIGFLTLNEQGETLLHQAVKDEDIFTLSNLLQLRQIDINSKDNNGNTPLHVAVTNSRGALIPHLVSAGADASLKNKQKKSALDLVVEQNNNEMLQIMKGAGVSLSPLVDTAIENSNLELTRVLLNSKIDIKSFAHKAIDRSNIIVLEEIFLTKPDMANNDMYTYALNDAEVARSILSYVSADDFNFDQALHSTTSAGKSALIPDLLKAGADPTMAISQAVMKGDEKLLIELVEVYGANPDMGIQQAVATNNKNIFDILMLNGADANMALIAAVSYSNTPLVAAAIEAGAEPASDPELILQAVKKRNAQVVQLLLKNGADATPPSLIQLAAGTRDTVTIAALLSHGAIAQHAVIASVSSGSAAIIKQLVDAGADISSPELLISAVNADFRIGALRMLLDNGGDPDLKDADGRPLFVIAAAKGNTDSLAALISAGVNKEATDTLGNRAIHIAVQREKDTVEMVKFLIAENVELNAKNDNGKTARALASGIRVPWVLSSAGAEK